MATHKSGFFPWLQKQKAKISKPKQQPPTQANDTPAMVNPSTSVDEETAQCRTIPSKKAYAFEATKQPPTQANDTPATVNPPTLVDEETAQSRALPSKKAYAFEASKQTLEILSGIIGLVGIPLVKEVIEIGISIISTCETINQVQEQVHELKNRVAGFLVVIAKFAKDSESENDPMLKTSSHLREELEEFKQCLVSINDDLQAIANQSTILTTLLPAANIDTIEACAKRFQDAIDRFQTLRGIHAAQDLNQIQNQLRGLYKLVSERFEQLSALLERTQLETDLAITSVELPPLPDVFLGRKEVVDRIAEQLASCQVEKSRVCVLGPGGMGKSSVALAVMEHAAIKERFSSKNRLWIPCVSLRSPSALLAHLARRLGTSTQADPLEATVSILKTDGPYLIHLDNFETPWRPTEGSQASTKRIIQKLDGISNVSILITMRSNTPPLHHWNAERLDVLSLDDCRQIYTTIVGESEKGQELDTLLESIGCLPYAVMLLAKQAEHSGLSPAELLQRWKSDGSKLLSDVEGTTRGMEASIELSIRSPYVIGCSGALQLLQTLSLLPAGVYRDDLLIWMKSWEVAALGTLRNACLLVAREVATDGQKKKKTHLYVLPVVQSYFRQQDRIPTDVWVSTYNACFEFLLSHKCTIDGPNAPGFGTSRRAVAEQESNIQALLTEVLEALEPSDAGQIHPQNVLSLPVLRSEAWVEALLIFVSYQVYTKPRLDFAQRVFSITSSHSKGSPNFALATYRLAQTEWTLGSVSDAADLFQQARDLLLQSKRPVEACHADFRAIECSREVHGSVSDLPQAIADAQARWKDFMSDPTVCSIVSYWTSYLDFLQTPIYGDHSHLLSRTLEAKTALISQHRPADAQHCLQTIIRILFSGDKPEEARLFIEEAFKLTTEYDILDQGNFHYRLAQCLKASNSWGPELMTAIAQSITYARKAGLPYFAAMALEELGEVYVREEDWAAARLAYEEALKECKKGSGFSIDRVAERVQSNLIYITAIEANDSDWIEFLPPPRS